MHSYWPNPAVPTLNDSARKPLFISGTPVTVNVNEVSIANIGPLAADTVVNNPTGNQVDGMTLSFRCSQDGTGGRTLTWGVQFAFGTDVTEALIPTTAGAKWEIVFRWFSGDSKWRAVGIARGF